MAFELTRAPQNESDFGRTEQVWANTLKTGAEQIRVRDLRL
jgi:hypothetical protein